MIAFMALVSRRVGASALLASALVAFALVAILSRSDDSRARVVDEDSSVPDGWKRLAYRGVELNVPHDWERLPSDDCLVSFERWGPRAQSLANSRLARCSPTRRPPITRAHPSGLSSTRLVLASCGPATSGRARWRSTSATTTGPWSVMCWTQSLFLEFSRSVEALARLGKTTIVVSVRRQAGV